MSCGLDMVWLHTTRWPREIGGRPAKRAPDNRNGRKEHAVVTSSRRCRPWAAALLTVIGWGCASTTPAPIQAFEGAALQRDAANALDSGVRPAVAPNPVAVEVVNPDPGAEALIDLIDQALIGVRQGPGGLTSIGLGKLANRSTASADEFSSFVARLAGLLDDAGGAKAIDFYTDPDEPVDFELRGTVYLITAAGFDHWELYLDLRPTALGWSIPP